MSDPTLPRHARTRTPTCCRGEFVKPSSGPIVLVDSWGNTWQLEQVSFLTGGFGFKEEGAFKLPRPNEIDGQGKVKVPGDRVMILFEDGDPLRPIVLPGVRAIKPNAFFPASHLSEGANPNRWAARVQPLDGDGEATGEVRLLVANNDKGSVSLQATEGITTQVGEDLEGDTFLTITVTQDMVTISKGGTTEAVVLGETFLGGLKDWLTGFSTFLTSLASAADTAGVNAAASAMQGAHNTFAGKVSSSVSAPGAPYLSEVTETE